MTLPQINVTHRAKPARRVQRAAQKRPAAPAQTQPAPQAAAVPASNLPGSSPDQQRYQLPQTGEGITARRLEQTVNIVDSEDAVKYLPSLSLRKRNAGDNQTVLASRVWGLNSSARTLVYADDILLSAPSIVLGLFVYAMFVMQTGGRFSAIAGALSIVLIFRDRGWHPAGAIVAALSFAFGAAAAWRIQHVGQVLSLGYFAITLFLLSRALERLGAPAP